MKTVYGAAFVALASLSHAALANAAATAPPVVQASPGASSPISIAPGCSYKTLRSGYGFGNVTLNVGHGYNFFTVTYTNGAAVAADDIVFQIDFDKASRIVIPDVGKFAPGSTTTTTFRDSGKGMTYGTRPTPNDGAVDCTVLSAHFVDGTTYTAPPAPAPVPSPT